VAKVLIGDEKDDVVQALRNNTTATPPAISSSPQSSSIFTYENLNLLTESTDMIAYFYLKNEIGMSEEAMWKITLEAGSALGMRRKVACHDKPWTHRIQIFKLYLNVNLPFFISVRTRIWHPPFCF
jgi:hypothetical protein